MAANAWSFDRAGELVANALAGHDPQLAELLLAEDASLREGGPPGRVRVQELLQEAAQKRSRARSQFSISIHHLFGENLTLLEEGGDTYVWVYDDDIVSLTDVDRRGDPWAHNLDAKRCLREVFGSWRASLVRSVRLCLFGGSQETAAVLAELGAADRVTHLELRTQRENEQHVAIGAAFPALRGLTCAGEEARQLLSAGAPELRSLIVRGDAWDPAIADLAAAAPKLVHLGLFHVPTTPADLERLAAHPVMNRITSLEIFSTNHATSFPFETLLRLRDSFVYLQHVRLAGHLVPDSVRLRFEDWPEVELVTWDRRETMALDFQTTGWGASAR